MGRAPRTKETLPNFREWCRATRHPDIPRVDGLSTDPRNGVSHNMLHIKLSKSLSIV